MRLFKVRLADGSEHEVRADRAVADAAFVSFQVRSNDRWEVVLQLDTASIVSLTRRLTEVDGDWLWVPTDPQRASGV